MINSKITVYDTLPEGFSSVVEVAAIYVRADDKLLLLQLASTKQEAGAWGVPAGKLEVGESPAEGAKRELFEETGITVNSVRPLGQLYMRKPDMNYTYYLFGINLNSLPTVHLSTEHSGFKWVSPDEAESLPLMLGAKEALDAYYLRN